MTNNGHDKVKGKKGRGADAENWSIRRRGYYVPDSCVKKKEKDIIWGDNVIEVAMICGCNQILVVAWKERTKRRYHYTETH